MTNPEHERTYERIGAFVDGELSPAQTARVQAHLLSCPSCRANAQSQRALKRRLPELLPIDSAERALANLRLTLQRRHHDGARRSRRTAVVLVSCAAAAVLASVSSLRWLSRGSNAQHDGPVVPMARQAIEQYVKRIQGGLPVAPIDLDAVQLTTGLPARSLEHQDAKLMAAWVTELRGQRAAALAYRYRSRIVIQYIVSEELFYRPSIVRKTIRERGRYVTRAGEHVVVGWPIEGAGVLLVGDLPASELDQLRRLRRSG